MSKYRSTHSLIKSHQSSTSLPKEEVNVVLLGKQNVGKSALVVKYLTKRFICEYDPFLGESTGLLVEDLGVFPFSRRHLLEAGCRRSARSAGEDHGHLRKSKVTSTRLTPLSSTITRMTNVCLTI